MIRHEWFIDFSAKCCADSSRTGAIRHEWVRFVTNGGDS